MVGEVSEQLGSTSTGRSCVVGAPIYSPLCDADGELYRRYIALFERFLEVVREDVECGISVDTGSRVSAGYVGHVGGTGNWDSVGGLEDNYAVGVGAVGEGTGVSGAGAAGVGGVRGRGALVSGGAVSGLQRGAGGFVREDKRGGAASGVPRGSEREVGLSAVPEWRRGIPRGPNFMRNQEARMRQRVKREERKLAAAGVGVEDPCAELAQRVRRMRLQRQELQEKRKLEKLGSLHQVVEDAMRQVALAERYAKVANDSRVVEWAARVSSASAESLARSSGSYTSAEPEVAGVVLAGGSSGAAVVRSGGVPETRKVVAVPAHVTASGRVNAAEAKKRWLAGKYALEAMEPSQAEQVVLDAGLLSRAQLVVARGKSGGILRKQQLLEDPHVVPFLSERFKKRLEDAVE